MKVLFTLLFNIDAALRLPPVYLAQYSNNPSKIGLKIKIKNQLLILVYMKILCQLPIFHDIILLKEFRKLVNIAWCDTL